MRSGRETVEAYYAALARGDFAEVVALHAPDLVCWMCGNLIVSGCFDGVERLYAHMGEYVVGPLVIGTESYVKASRIVFGAEPYVVGLFRGGLPTKAGGRYDQHYLQAFRVEHGLIQEIVEFFDTVMFETSVMGNRLADTRDPVRAPYRIGTALGGGVSQEEMRRLAVDFVATVQGGYFEEVERLLGADAELAVLGASPHGGVDRFEAGRLASVLAGGVASARVIAVGVEGALVLAKAADARYGQNWGVLLEADGRHIQRITVFEDTAAAERYRYGNLFTKPVSQSIKPPFDIDLAFRSE